MTAAPPAPAVTQDDVERYALGLIGEECAEAGQMTGKWHRFGGDHARRDGLTARRGLSLELGDVLAAIDYAIGAGVVDPVVAMEQRERKYARLTDAASVDDEGRRLAPPVARHRLATEARAMGGESLTASEIRDHAIAVVQAEARDMGYTDEDVADIALRDGDDGLAVQAVERALTTSPLTASRRGVPDGWQMVPVEPTFEMLGAAYPLNGFQQGRRDWYAMLAAAPTPPVQGDAS